MDIEEELARVVNHAGWTCDGGSDEPSQYDDCEDCKRVCDKFSAVLMPLVRRAQAEAGAKALRDFRQRLMDQNIDRFGVVLPDLHEVLDDLDEEATRIEQEVEHE